MQRLLLALMLILLFAADPAAAQIHGPRRPAPQKPEEVFPRAGVVINGITIMPGEVIQMLFGAAGAPDFVRAVRGKEAGDDYVMFAYDSYGLSVHVSNHKNQNNLVGVIVVKTQACKLENVPFSVGDDYKSVMEMWGQPDRQEPGFMAYWKRGIYVAVGDDGKISSITVAEPGKFDDDQPAAGQG